MSVRFKMEIVPCSFIHFHLLLITTKHSSNFHLTVFESRGRENLINFSLHHPPLFGLPFTSGRGRVRALHRWSRQTNQAKINKWSIDWRFSQKNTAKWKKGKQTIGQNDIITMPCLLWLMFVSMQDGNGNRQRQKLFEGKPSPLPLADVVQKIRRAASRRGAAQI